MRTMRTIIAAVAVAAVLVAPMLVEPTPVSADGCYTWTRTLRLTSPPMQGEDVQQLQIRLAGWGGFRNHVDITGVFGLQLLGLTGWVTEVFYGVALVLAVTVSHLLQRRVRG